MLCLVSDGSPANVYSPQTSTHAAFVITNQLDGTPVIAYANQQATGLELFDAGLLAEPHTSTHRLGERATAYIFRAEFDYQLGSYPISQPG